MKKIWLLTTLLIGSLLLTGCLNKVPDCLSWEAACTKEIKAEEPSEDIKFQNSNVIYWWIWTHEIVGDKTIYYDSWYWISFRLWEDFSWGRIVERDTEEWDTINENLYNLHRIEVYKKDWWWEWYGQVFIINAVNNEQFNIWKWRPIYNENLENDVLWTNNKYSFWSTNIHNNWIVDITNERVTDMHIFDVEDIENNWEDDCIHGVNDWLKNMEPNWVFSEIVRSNDNWEYAFKVDWMNMKTKSWVLYYTNNNTKRKLDFQCWAEVEAASTSTSFWSVEFVE